MVTRGEDGLARVGVRYDTIRKLRPGSMLNATYRPGEVDVVEGEAVWLVCGDEAHAATVAMMRQVFDPLERVRISFVVEG